MVGIVAALLAAWFDLKRREVPDWITLTLILAGTVFSLLERGLGVTAGTLFIGGALAEFLYRQKVFGGGDLKLLLGLVLVGGPLYGLAVFYGSLLAALPLFFFYLLKEKTRKPDVPYAVAILAGVFWVYWKGVWII